MSSIYLMKNMANGYYKIGSSRRPAERERTLQAQEPDIRLVAAVEENPRFERELHRRYAPKRLRGEWFALQFGDLYELAREFATNAQEINPPMRVLAHNGWCAAVHRLSPSHEYTWVTYRNGKFLFEMPFAMTRCEIDELVGARAFGCDLPEELLTVLSTSLRNYLRDCYEAGDVKIELREVCCMGSGESQGYIVIDQRGHDRFFPSYEIAKVSAQTYFKAMCRYHDGYAQLWAEADLNAQMRTKGI